MKLSKTRLITFCLAAIFIAACESLGPSMRDKLPLEPVAIINDEDKLEHESRFTQLDNATGDKAVQKPAVEIYPGTGAFINSGAARRAKGREPGTGKYTLNFDDADLGEVAKVILSDTLGENYVLAPTVSGRVTLQTTRPLTREELIPTLEMLLRMNGAVLIIGDSGYRIEPAANALQGATSPRLGLAGSRLPNGYQIRIVPLQYIGVQEMQKILEPLLPPKSIIRADISRNMMMVAGTGAELDNILETIQIFDVNLMKGKSVLLYPLKNVDVATIIGELEGIFGSDAETPLSGMFRLVPIERMNAVMVITPQPRYLREAKVWLDRLDRSVEETGAGAGGVYVYRVQNVEAADLASILNDIFSQSKKSSTPRAQLAPGRRAAEISGDKKPGDNTAAKAKAGGNQLNVGAVADVRIIADEKNNSLVIVATAQAYEILKKVISQLDVPPLQVLIDATVVEITLSDNLQYGLQWFFRHSVGPYGATAVLSDTSPNTTGGQALAGAGTGFSYSLLNDAGTIRAVLTALASNNKVNVVSSPSLMVLNNQEAFINVGTQVPTATSTTSNTSGATATGALVTTQIQTVDTGVTLKIKPRVNAGGLVIMDVEQEVKDAFTTNTSNLNSPSIAQRKITSVISVQSGETIVLGGLITYKRTRTGSGVPFLSKLPWVGWLFSKTTKDLQRTELVVLITPRVVQNRLDSAFITTEFKRKLTGLYQDMSEDKADNTESGAAPATTEGYSE